MRRCERECVSANPPGDGREQNAKASNTKCKLTNPPGDGPDKMKEHEVNQTNCKHENPPDDGQEFSAPAGRRETEGEQQISKTQPYSIPGPAKDEPRHVQGREPGLWGRVGGNPQFSITDSDIRGTT